MFSNCYVEFPDIRKTVAEPGKSINLAMSNRARMALREIGIEQEVLKNAVAMKGRLIHDVNGNTRFLPYDIRNKDVSCVCGSWKKLCPTKFSPKSLQKV